MNSGSIPSLETDKLDEAIERFELNWVSGRCYLEKAVEELGALHSMDGLAELLRSDVDLRYRSGGEVDLEWYKGLFQAFPRNTLNNDRAWKAVAYEDFRARRSSGLPLCRSRWEVYPQLHQESWIRQLDHLGSEGGVAGQVAALKTEEEPKAMPLAPPKAAPSSIQKKAASENDPESPEVGQTFGEFYLHGLLGTGAFSKVFLASQPSLASRYVALKVVTRLLDEPKHLARLQHTGIVPLYSLHRIGGYSALCMPYYGAATLADMLGEHSESSCRNGQSLVRTVQSALHRITVDASPDAHPADDTRADPVRQLGDGESSNAALLERVSKLSTTDFPLWFATRTAAALSHAHERQIVHGDLKPANILIRNDGEPALIDFNLSQSSFHAVTNHVGGTLPYMSPEQMRSLLGRELPLSPASDVFSFGVVMFQLIEGKLPFDAPMSVADSDVEVAVLARKSRVNFRSKLVSSGLKSIVSKCLCWDPALRYSNATELWIDLECEASLKPLKLSRESLFRSRIPKAIKRHPKLFSILPLSLALLSATLLCVWLTLQWGKQHRVEQAMAAFVRWEDSRLNYIDLVSVSSPADLDHQFAAINSAQSSILVDGTKMQSANLLDSVHVDLVRLEQSKHWNGWTESQRTAIASDLGTVCFLASSIASENQIKLTSTQEKMVQRWLSIKEIHRSKIPTNRLEFAIKLMEVREHRQAGEIDRAEEVLSECIPDALTAPAYWIAMGDLLSAKRQYSAALIAFERSIEAAPQSAAPYLYRARLREQLGSLDLAEMDYTRAIELQAGQASLWADRARLRGLMEKWEDAIVDMSKAIEIAPTANRFYLSRSRMLQKVNRVVESKKDLHFAMRHVPQTPEDWISRALAHLPKDPDLALQDLRSAESLDPGRADVLQNMAHVLHDYQQDVQGAVSCLTKILESTPQNEMARVDRAVLFGVLGDQAKATSDIAWLLQTEARLDPSTFYQIGCVYAQLSRNAKQNRPDAIRYLTRAVFQGYGKELLSTDSHLDPIRDDPQFQSLVVLCSVANGEAPME